MVSYIPLIQKKTSGTLKIFKVIIHEIDTKKAFKQHCFQNTISTSKGFVGLFQRFMSANPWEAEVGACHEFEASDIFIMSSMPA